MTLEELREKVRQWDLRNTGSADDTAYYSTILAQLDYHATREWRVYLPAENPVFHQNYMERLAKWIGNLSNEADQKLLLEYALYISFFSHDDFLALYLTALNREVTRWVASLIGARLEPHGGEKLHDQVHKQIHHHTWFCPVTDSMDINQFQKINHLSGVGHHPFFATIQMEAENPIHPNPQIAEDWIRYMARPSAGHASLEQIVLIEDIVGSGTQCLAAVQWAVATLGKPVLFIPLILCPNGIDALRAEEVRWGGRLTIRPVIELRRSDLLGPERQGQQGWAISENMEDLAERCSFRASAGMETFGYKNTGCSLAKFSNTPDNTLPIVHNKPRGGNWEPLFPRVHRD
jgi:hypothetical protein